MIKRRFLPFSKNGRRSNGCRMKHEEQKRKIEDLRRFLNKMSASERMELEMMVKRKKDDEDLDSLTTNKLQALHEKYLPKKSKEELELIWKKMGGDHS